MAEDNGDKTEAPTPRRRQEARDQGNIARSADLSSAAVLLGGLVLLHSFGTGLITAMRGVMVDALGPASMKDITGSFTGAQLEHSIFRIAVAIAPLFVGLVIIAVATSLLQVGLVLNFARLQPNLNSLNPANGISRIFSGGRGLVQMGMNLAKVGLVGMAAFSAISGRMEQIISAQSLDFIQIFGLGAQVIYAIALRIAIVLLLLAILDYIYQRYRLEQQLKMSKADVKEEMRSMDGDPKVKQRRRQVALQRHKARLKKEVPKADVIVTNPTHYAIALKYDANTMHAPRVVAKGQDLMAQRIREIAIEAGIPIVERPPLARAIYRMDRRSQKNFTRRSRRFWRTSMN